MVRYNTRKNFTANQKQFLYVPKFAEQIRNITSRPFFINNCDIKDSDIEGGILERIAYESVMITNFIDKWNKTGNKNPLYINENATVDQFEKLNNNIVRLENIVTDNTKLLFNARDSFIWFALFDKFTQTGFDDVEFGRFLNAFVNGLRDKEVDGKQFDRVDDTGSTKDKANIVAKLHILETLMNEFLHINNEDTEEVDYKEFLKVNVEDVVDENDIEMIQISANEASEELDENSWMLSDQNYPSYLAIVGVAFRKDEEDKLKEWLPIYISNNQFIRNQQKAFLHMKESFEAYLKKGMVA